MLYRIFDWRGDLLYVGTSLALLRLTQQVRSQPWAAEMRCVEPEWLMT
jgi:hypothetical protein